VRAQNLNIQAIFHARLLPDAFWRVALGIINLLE
jgi:hypothetical protein